MKTFLFSLAALALLIGVILCNGVYIKNVTADMEQALLALPECTRAAEEANALFGYWHTRENMLGVVIPATDMREIVNHLTELCVAAKLDDEETFEQARALCLADITRIRDLERFSLLHIL